MPATLSAIGCKGTAGPPGIRWLNIGGLQNLTFGAWRDDTEGNPAAPCLQLKWVSAFRFRAVFYPGDWTLSVLAKQPCNLSPRPSLVIRKNTDMGINADVTGTAGAGTGWVTISADFTVTTLGGTYVDLCSNTTEENALPCKFDHLSLAPQ